MRLIRYTKDSPPLWANDPIENDSEAYEQRLARRAQEHQATKARRVRRQARASRKLSKGR